MKLHQRVIETCTEGNKEAELGFPAQTSKGIVDELVMLSKQPLYLRNPYT